MKLKKLALLGAIAITAAPLAAQADITIYNNTNSPATAYVNNSPCSNAAGSKGIIMPHQSISVPDWAANLFCSHECTANVFMTKNCSGKSVASVTGNTRDGVKKVDNHHVNGYRVVGNGKSVTIEGGPQKKKWYQLFF